MPAAETNRDFEIEGTQANPANFKPANFEFKTLRFQVLLPPLPQVTLCYRV